jgi:glucose-6-phosphate 1-epimerase
MQNKFSGFNSGIHEIVWLAREVWLVIQPWGELVVAKNGAQVLHYKPLGHHSVFWLNETIEPVSVDEVANADNQLNPLIKNQPVRGGVPICWPWFGAHGTDSKQPNHGVARTIKWRLESYNINQNNGLSSQLVFVPEANPYPVFELKLQLDITQNTFQMCLETKNISHKKQSLTQAIHSYFLVGDKAKINVNGLKNNQYIDLLDKSLLKMQTTELSNIDAIDRIYKHTQDLVIEDQLLGRKIYIEKGSSGSTVVWNPGSEKAHGTIDNPNMFICLEAANTSFEEIVLQPNQAIELVQKIII